MAKDWVDNRLAQPVTDFSFEVTKGDVQGHVVVHKFGSCQAVGTAWKVVTTSKLYPTPVAAVALEAVSSDNTNDIPAGTGARTVRITGIKDWTTGQETQDVSLNGTTAVAAGSWLRVYRMAVVSSGAYATDSVPSHNSTLTLRVASAGATWQVIEAEGGFGFGQTEIGVYSIAAGKKGYIRKGRIKVESTKAADVALFVRENADDVATPYSGVMQIKEVFRSLTGVIDTEHNAPIGPFIGPCDFGYFAKSDSGTADISVDFEIWIVDDV
jgi:hypothetical protein